MKHVFSKSLSLSVGSLGVALASLFAGQSAFAQAMPQDSGPWYGAVSSSRSSNTIDHAGIERGLYDGGITTVGGLGTVGIADDNTTTSWSIVVGRNINQYFGIEMGYIDLGKFEYNATTDPNGTFTGKLRIRAEQLVGVAKYPMDNNNLILARLGILYTQAHEDFSGTGAVQILRSQDSDNGLGSRMGVGFLHKFNTNWAVEASADRYWVDDATQRRETIVSYGIALRYTF